MDFFVWSTIILGIWSAIGPLVGVRYGQDLARRNQRTQWILDNHRVEWKELINAIDATFTQYIEYRNTSVKGPEEHAMVQEAERRFLVTVRDRLFIAEEVEALKVYERFIKAIRTFETRWGVNEFAEEYGAIKKDVLAAARKNL